MPKKRTLGDREVPRMEEMKIRRKFDAYIERDLFSGDMRNMFQRWDIDKALKDISKWSSQAQWLNLYIIANACEYRTLHAWVGCNSNVEVRVSQHNGIAPGGPAATRKAAGYWKPILYVEIPPIRNYSTKPIKKMCKRGRGWESRCKRALNMAINKGLTWKISRSVFDRRTPFASESIISFMKERGIDIRMLNPSLYLD